MPGNADLTYRWFEEVWNNDNEAAIDEMMVPDVVAHGLGPDFSGRDNFHAFYRRFREPFSSVRVTLDRVVEVDDETAFRGRAVATAKGTGQRYEFDGAGWIRFQDGRIVEGWNYWDFMQLGVQAGTIPATAVDDTLHKVAGAPATA